MGPAIEARLPPILELVKSENLNIVFVSDPMHGNTYQTESKIKTRSVTKIKEEIQLAHKILNDSDLILAGIHLEMVGDNVTECVNGVDELGHADLS
jgi:3-deoxy-7-phosphoheptulonate synthase